VCGKRPALVKSGWLAFGRAVGETERVAGSIRRGTWRLAGAGAYLGLRLFSFVGIAGHASSFTDSRDYAVNGHLSLFSLD
jgi:hypothetical protein